MATTMKRARQRCKAAVGERVLVKKGQDDEPDVYTTKLSTPFKVWARKNVEDAASPKLKAICGG